MAPALAFQSPVGEGADWTCATGAAAIKTKIEAYWRDRGYEVQVMLVDGPFSPALRASRVDVRSELINGLPRAALKRAPAAAMLD
ncbi:MAG: hypothetical protein ABL883_06120 [Terricaulis sp.]